MEKTWLKQYPAGVPATIDVEQYASLVALLDESFRKYGDRNAYKFMGKAITFAQIDDASRALAAYLQGLGLEKGDYCIQLTEPTAVPEGSTLAYSVKVEITD